jgi:hypothetical protein
MSDDETEVRFICAALWPGCCVTFDTHRGGRGRATVYSVLVTEGRAVRLATVTWRMPSDVWRDAKRAVDRALVAATPREVAA